MEIRSDLYEKILVFALERKDSQHRTQVPEHRFVTRSFFSCLHSAEKSALFFIIAGS